MRYLIDANCVIYLFAGKFPKLSDRIEATAQGEIGLSTIVVAELLMGTAQGKPPSIAVLDELAKQMPVVAFDEEAARGYALTPFKRARFDRLLAGHALALDQTIITANPRDFADVPGLRVEDWTL